MLYQFYNPRIPHFGMGGRNRTSIQKLLAQLVWTCCTLDQIARETLPQQSRSQEMTLKLF